MQLDNILLVLQKKEKSRVFSHMQDSLKRLDLQLINPSVISKEAKNIEGMIQETSLEESLV